MSEKLPMNEPTEPVTGSENEVAKNYYEVLGVPKDAKQEDVNSAFRNLAKQYHPDNDDTGNSEKFKIMSEAHFALERPDRRETYDLSLRQPNSQLRQEANTSEEHNLHASERSASVANAFDDYLNKENRARNANVNMHAYGGTISGFKETYKGKKLSRLSPQEEIMAVEEGIKPVAFLNEPIETILPCLTFEVPVISTNESDVVTRVYKEKKYIYYAGRYQEPNAQRVRELIVQMNNEQVGNLKVGDVYVGKPTSDDYHRELGRLLGYGKEEIDTFVENRPK